MKQKGQTNETAKVRVRKTGRVCSSTVIAGLCGSCVILIAGGLAVEMKEHLPVVSVICGLINIQCVGSSALPVSTTCCPLSKAKKKNMSIPDRVGASERCVCVCVLTISPQRIIPLHYTWYNIRLLLWLFNVYIRDVSFPLSERSCCFTANKLFFKIINYQLITLKLLLTAWYLSVFTTKHTCIFMYYKNQDSAQGDVL